jgi:hypothetical protein
LVSGLIWRGDSYKRHSSFNYLNILLASCLFFVFRNTSSVAALLVVQPIYKIATPITVGTLQGPVVISNLGIAIFHGIALLAIWRTMGNPFEDLDPAAAGDATR